MLLELNIQVRVFSFYPVFDNWFIEHGVEHQSFFSKPGVSKLKKLLYPLAYFKAKTFLRRNEYDVVNAHYASSYGLLAALLKPKKLMLNFWGTDIFVFPKKSLLHKKLIQWIMSKADILCASSRILYAEVRSYTKQDVVIVPFGIHLEKYSFKTKPNLIKKNDSIKLGLVKSLEPIYRIDVAIDALNLLNQKSPYHFELHIAGSGSQEVELKARKSEAVFFYGRIVQEDVPNFLNRLDVFLNVTDFESFGVSTIEAMACGVPVVAHDAGGSAEIIEHKVNGMLYSPNDPKVLADKILELVENPKQRDALALQARNDVENRYSLTVMKLKISSVLNIGISHRVKTDKR